MKRQHSTFAHGDGPFTFSRKTYLCSTQVNPHLTLHARAHLDVQSRIEERCNELGNLWWNQPSGWLHAQVPHSHPLTGTHSLLSNKFFTTRCSAHETHSRPTINIDIQEARAYSRCCSASQSAPTKSSRSMSSNAESFALS